MTSGRAGVSDDPFSRLVGGEEEVGSVEGPYTPEDLSSLPVEG